MSGVQNPFGQSIYKGSWVGWGGRDGNLSARKVGVVEDLAAIPEDYYRRTKARVHWYSPREFTSQVIAEDLFIIHPDTLDREIVHKWHEHG